MLNRRSGRPVLGIRVSLAVACFCYLLITPPAGAERLEDALAEAYQSNPTLLAARAELRAVIEEVPQAVAGYRPSVTSSVGTTVADLDTNEGDSSFESTTTSLTVTQNLYEGGGTVASIDSAEAFYRAQKGILQSVEQDVLLDAVVAYTSVFRDQRVVELAENNLSRLRRQLQATIDRFNAGDQVTRTDVAQGEAAVSGAIADLVAAQSDLGVSIADYVAVVGSQPGLLEPVLTPPDIPATLEEAYAREVNNPLIITAQENVFGSDADVRVARSDLLPSLDLSGELSYTDEPSAMLDRERALFFGATLSVPLYQQGAEYSELRQAKQVLFQRRRELDEAQRDVMQEVTSAWQELVAARAQIDAFREQVRANEVALDGVRQEALVGTRLVLDILDAEQELFESEIDLVEAQQDQTVSEFTLLSAVGALTAEQIDLPVDLHDPDAYFRRVRNQFFGADVDGE